MGSVYIGMGGGVTGDIQVNYTDIHAPPLNKKYCELEQSWMIEHLRIDPSKSPQPTCNDMMRILVESPESINIDIPACYKGCFKGRQKSM